MRIACVREEGLVWQDTNARREDAEKEALAGAIRLTCLSRDQQPAHQITANVSSFWASKLLKTAAGSLPRSRRQMFGEVRTGLRLHRRACCQSDWLLSAVALHGPLMAQSVIYGCSVLLLARNKVPVDCARRSGQD